MLLVRVALAFCLTIVGASAVAQPPLQPSVGMRLPAIGGKVLKLPGWSIETMAAWCEPFSLECGYTLLRSGNRVAVALTKPTKISPRGGGEEGVITHVFIVKIKSRDEFVECGSVGGRTALMGLLDRKERRVRIYTTNGAELVMTEQTYPGLVPCGVDVE
jgi:hypothetical protein